MKGTPMSNAQLAIQHLTINLPDGNIVKSTHVCNLMIRGLPTLLEGHIDPDLTVTVASLVGICILCKAGYIVVFTDTACYVIYNQKIILTGASDPSTDLWTLPIIPDAITLITSQEGQWTIPEKSPPRAGSCIACAPQLPLAQTMANPQAVLPIELATYTHSICTQANAIKFVHQLLCNPKLFSLIKVLCKGFSKGAPISVRNL
jgi:hypothetical protein